MNETLKVSSFFLITNNGLAENEIEKPTPATIAKTNT